MMVERGFTDWHLAIAGDGKSEYRASLSTLVQKLSLGGKIDFLGQIVGKAKEELYEDADVFIVPSHRESFCIAIAEALAHGVPVIASKYAPWPRLVDERCGLWVENSSSSLANAILEAESMPLRDMGNRGRAWIEREFSWKVSTERVLATYAEMKGK